MFINSTYKHPLNSGCGPRTPTNPHFNHKIVWGTHVNLLQTLMTTMPLMSKSTAACLPFIFKKVYGQIQVD